MDLPKTRWQPAPPAELRAVEELLTKSRLKLPQSFVEFLLLSNGGEGSLGIEPGWFSLWRAEEIVQLNHDYEVQQWLPDFWGFGSNGGGEMFAFNTSEPEPWKVYMLPFVGFEEADRVVVAESFDEFVNFIGQSCD